MIDLEDRKLFLGIGLILAFFITAALAIGVSWRLFLWASGLGG